MPRHRTSAPGTNRLMREVTMRDAINHRRSKQRRGRNFGNYNRPRNIWYNGENIPLHPLLYGEKPVILDPNSQLKVLLRNDPRRLDWMPDGLARDPIQRRLDYEQAQWLCQEFPSPYKRKHSLGRRARDKARLRPRPEDLPEREFMDLLRHRNRNPNMRDPRTIPPSLPNQNFVYLSDGLCQIPGRRGGQPRLVQGIPHPADRLPNSGNRRHNNHRGRVPLAPFGPRGGERVHIPRRNRPGFHPDFDPLDDEGEPTFVPRRPFGPRDYDDEDEGSTSSQHSAESYVRAPPLSPNIVYAKLPPRHHGRHFVYPDDEEDDDIGAIPLFRQFFARGRHHRGMEREGGRFGRRRRHFEDEGSYSGDEEDDWGY